MNKPIALLLSLSTLSIVCAPSLSVDAKSLKGKVSASSAKKGANASRAKLIASPVYKEGLELFGKRNYSGALKCFFKLDSTGFCCDLVHYYIGQCYQKTNQTVAAQQHYDWVLQRSKDPTLRTYADYGNQVMAYYSHHRTFAGQGNNFDGGALAGRSGGGSSRQGFG